MWIEIRSTSCRIDAGFLTAGVFAGVPDTGWSTSSMRAGDMVRRLCDFFLGSGTSISVSGTKSASDGKKSKTLCDDVETVVDFD